MSRYKGFTQVELRKPQKSMFDLSHEKRISTSMHRLTPVLITECMPGDKFSGGSEILLRLAPLLAPIYDQIQLFVHYFFVPNRLIWEDWEEFITGGRLGVGVDPEEAPIPPFLYIYDLLDGDYCLESSLFDYLAGCTLPQSGFTTEDYTGLTIDAMPFCAYQLVWSEYYRDRNFIDDQILATGFQFPIASGDVTDTVNELAVLRNRDYLKEYFTSALPFTQRGTEVLMPMAGTGSVTYLPVSEIRDEDGFPVTGMPYNLRVDSGSQLDIETVGKGRIENIDEVDFNASSVSINDFRSAYALQVWLERNAIAGSRYTESVQAHFAVKPQDSRLQRPEFIGGGRIPVRISEVVSTAYADNEANESVPQGNLAGHGVTYGNTNRFRYFCTEHGFIIGLASIVATPSYHQGLPRMFRRKSFLSYPWPTFAKLGEQQIDKAELYASPANLTEDTNGQLPLFGYTSRYADWKYIPNTSHGAFHSTLLYWTLTRNFNSSPELGEQFVAFNQDTQARIFAAGEVINTPDYFWMYVHNQLSVIRSLPYFGTPNTIGF